MKIHLKIHLKIPGVAKQEKGRQEVAPNPDGGRAARTRASGPLRFRRAHVSPLPGGLRHGLDTQPRASRSVPSVSRSNPSSAQLQRAGTGRACLVLRSRQPASGARETPVSPACSPPEEGRQSSVRETHLDQLRLRACCTTTPRSHLAGSTLQHTLVPAPFSSAFLAVPAIALHLKIT